MRLKHLKKNAVDYLLKPISKDRFEQGLSKFRNAFANQNNGSSTTTTVEKVAAITEEESLERIVVKKWITDQDYPRPTGTLFGSIRRLC